MMGMVLAQLAIGVAQGYSVVRQGKKLMRAGEDIRNIYGSLRSEEKKFKESERNLKDSAKKIKTEQDLQAKVQYDYNRLEIKKALENNLRGVISGYVAKREDLEQEISTVKSKLAFMDVKNVEETSLKTDSINKMKAEANLKAEAILHNQRTDMNEVQNQFIGQEYQNRNSYNKTQEGINQNFLSAFSNAELQFKRDLSQLNSTINSGEDVGQNIINQGMFKKAQGDTMIAQAFLEAGKGAISSYGGASGISSKLSSAFGTQGSGSIKEIVGTYNSNPTSFFDNSANTMRGANLWQTTLFKKN